jgi:cytochrome c-type biogenesis protein
MEELPPLAASLTALAAGLLSFASPCVLPLMPAYLSFVTGLTVEELSARPTGTAGGRAIRRNAALFVLGFSVVFVAGGILASMAGRGLSGLGFEVLGNRVTLIQLAGAVIVLFGLHLAGAVRIPWLYRERRLRAQGGGAAGAALLGAAFALGWTPCIGPVLAGILTLAASEGTVARGAALLSLYSIGLGLPFLLMAMSFDRASGWIVKLKPHFRAVEIASGALLVGVGLLVVLDRLTALNQAFAFLGRWVIAAEQWLL